MYGGEFVTCWDLKAETGVSEKNKVLGVVKGYGIFKVSQNMSKKGMAELMTDIDELCEHKIEKFIVLCSSGERMQEFTEIANSRITRAKVIHVLPYSSSGLQIMDVIVGIEDWKQRVAEAVYGEVKVSRYRGIFDFETNDKQIYVGIDGEIISKNGVRSNIIGGIRAEIEILCLTKQEWRFADILEMQGGKDKKYRIQRFFRGNRIRKVRG